MKTLSTDDLELVTNGDWHFTHPLFRQDYSVNLRVWRTPDGTKYALMITGGPEGIMGHTDGVEGEDRTIAAIRAGEMTGRTLVNLKDEMERRGFVEKGSVVGGVSFKKNLS